jgi:hypothetical protein
MRNDSVINKSLTKRDVQSFLKKNDTVAKFTLDFFDEYIKLCDQVSENPKKMKLACYLLLYIWENEIQG